MIFFWSVPRPGPLVWMVIKFNLFGCFSLGNSTFSAQFRLHLWGHSNSFPLILFPVYFSKSFVLWYLPFFRLLSYYFFFGQLIMLVGCIFLEHLIKFPFRIVIGTPPPILSISGNILFWYLDMQWFNIVRFLIITLVGLPYYSVVVGIGYVISSTLDCCKFRCFYLT